MKTACLFVFFFFAVPVFGQNADSLLAVKQVDSLILISCDFTFKGDYDKALEVNAAAEKIASERFGQESAAYGISCFNRGRILHFKWDFPKAEKWFLESKTIREKILGKEHPDYAWSLDYLAIVYSDMGYHIKAEPLQLEAKAIREKTLGKEHPDYARSLDNLGQVYGRMHDFEKAERYHLEAKAIQEKILGKEHPDYARTLSNLGFIYYLMDNNEKAELLYLEAKAIQEKALGKGHPEYVRNLRKLANLYGNLFQYERAEPLYLDAKTICEKFLGKNNLSYVSTLQDLGHLYTRMGSYEKAELLYLEAKAICEKESLWKESLYYAVSLSALAELYGDMGIYEKAESYNIEALAMIEKNLGKENLGYAGGQNNLGVMYMKMGAYEKAERLYLEALSFEKNLLGKEHASYATKLINLGKVYTNTGIFEKAESFLTEGVAILEKTLGKEHPDYATSIQNQGNLYAAMGVFTKAESLYREVKAIRGKKLGTAHPDYADCLNDLTRLYEDQGRFTDSEPLLKEHTELRQSLLSRSVAFLSEREIASYTATFREEEDNLYVYLFARLKKGKVGGILPSLCFDNSLFRRGFLLGAASRLNAIASFTPEATELNNNLKAYRRRLAAEYAKPIAERKGVEELEEKANAAEKELARTVAGYAEAIRQVKWQEVQAALKKGEAAVEFVHFRVNFPKNTDSTMYAALLLLPGMKQPRFIPLFEEKQLDSLLSAGQERREDYLNHIYASASRGLEPLRLKKLTGLYDLFWKPLEKHLRKAKTVYYSPSGLLHRLNIDAIPLPAGKKGQKGQILADRYRLVQLGSTRQLVVPASVKTLANDIALFGGIVYEVDTATLPAASSEALASRTRGGLSFAYSDSTLRSGTMWHYLSGTEREVRAVSDVARSAGMAVQAFTGSEATEEALKLLGTAGAGAAGSPKVLHLATHGFFFPDPKTTVDDRRWTVDGAEPVFKISEHPMIRSGLILAGGNHAWKTGKPIKEGLEDGILTAYEISQMNLSNTELVVLSACETGLGDIAGNEGVYGLQRAFKIAGAKYLIMSLWQVPDKQTSLLMTTFYRKWLEEKMPIPEAFRAAQKELREAGLDPYQWAGFVLVE